MAADPPTAQVSKDAREGTKCALARRAQGTRDARLCNPAVLPPFFHSEAFFEIGVKRPALSRGAGAAQAPAKRKGGIAGHEVPWRLRCASFARIAELAENTLARAAKIKKGKRREERILWYNAHIY